jgi:hypothetical protein
VLVALAYRQVAADSDMACLSVWHSATGCPRPISRGKGRFIPQRWRGSRSGRRPPGTAAWPSPPPIAAAASGQARELAVEDAERLVGIERHPSVRDRKKLASRPSDPPVWPVKSETWCIWSTSKLDEAFSMVVREIQAVLGQHRSIGPMLVTQPDHW